MIDKLESVKKALARTIVEFDSEASHVDNRTDMGANLIIKNAKAALAELNEVINIIRGKE